MQLGSPTLSNDSRGEQGEEEDEEEEERGTPYAIARWLAPRTALLEVDLANTYSEVRRDREAIGESDLLVELPVALVAHVLLLLLHLLLLA